MPSSGYAGIAYTGCIAVHAGRRPCMKTLGLMILSKFIVVCHRRAGLVSVTSLCLEREALPMNFEAVFYSI